MLGFQADPTQARRLGGMGLGLAISRRLVELMGGKIGLQSGKDGRGTLVWFTMPLAARSVPQTSAVGRQPRDAVRASQ